MNIIDRLIRLLGIPQNTDDFKWTRTAGYKRRLEWVKNAWIMVGMIMLIVAQPAFILVSGFFLTFLSLAFLERKTE